MSDSPPPAEPASLAYSYRPSLLGAPWEFELAGDSLSFRVGNRAGRIALSDIRRVRMSFRPASMQTQRFLTEIWAQGAPKLEICSSSWKSIVEQERLDRPYAVFVAELHRRLAETGAPARYEQGTNPFVYWPGLAVFIAVALVLAALIARGLQDHAWRGTAVVGAFLAFFLWQAGNYFRRNRPGLYRPDALPQVLMPDR
jgi:hypothetical protein